jgi:hypothetical protein
MKRVETIRLRRGGNQLSQQTTRAAAGAIHPKMR